MAADNVEPIWCSQCGEPLPASASVCAVCGTTNVLPSQGGDGKDGAPSYHRLRVGDVLDGKWRLESKLGAGGMGSVFLAHDLSLDRKVAVKVLAGQHCSDDEFMLRFEREARMTAKLEHPNIVPVFAVGRHFGRPFIVMKALQGMTLAKFVAQRATEGRKPTREEVLNIFRQLLAGLGFIHSKGYVHRDIKAGNVFVSTDWIITLLDFGVLRDTSQRSITRAGSLLGTPHYLSPEQALGMRNIDGRADLYSVGVLLYECLTLKPPFVGDALTLMRAHAEAPPPDPTAIAPDLPKTLGAVVQKALSKKPAERYSTAADLYSAIEQAWPAQPTAGAPAPAPLIPAGPPLSGLPPLTAPPAATAPAAVPAAPALAPAAPAPAPAPHPAPAAVPVPTLDLGLGDLAPAPAPHPAPAAVPVPTLDLGLGDLASADEPPPAAPFPSKPSRPPEADLPSVQVGPLPDEEPPSDSQPATAIVKPRAQSKPAEPDSSIFTVPTSIGPAPTAPAGRASRPSSPSPSAATATGGDTAFTAQTKVGPAPTSRPEKPSPGSGLGEPTAPRDLRALAAAVEAGAAPAREPEKAPDNLAPAEPGAPASELLPSIPEAPMATPDTAPAAARAASAAEEGKPEVVEDAFFDKPVQPEDLKSRPPAKAATPGRKKPMLALGIGAGALAAAGILGMVFALTRATPATTEAPPTPKPVVAKAPDNPPPAEEPKLLVDVKPEEPGPAGPTGPLAADPPKPASPDPVLDPLGPAKPAGDEARKDPSLNLAGLDLSADDEKKPDAKKPTRPEPKKPAPVVTKPEPRRPTPVTRAEPKKTEPVVAAKEPAKDAPKKMGKLRVATTLKGAPYWASVIIDGAAAGETPLTVELPVGKHKLRIERGGFAPVDKEVVVTAGKNPVVVGVELKP